MTAFGKESVPITTHAPFTRVSTAIIPICSVEISLDRIANEMIKIPFTKMFCAAR